MRCHAIRLTVLFSVLVIVTPAIGAEKCNASQHSNESTGELSGNAAKIVSSHLLDVVRLLRDGGPPVDHSKEEATKKWTVKDQIKKYGIRPGSYSEKQYLTDYRNSFLKTWSEYILEEVTRKPNGEFSIGSGSSFRTCCFQSPGTTSGHYDGQSLAMKIVSKAHLESPEFAALTGQSFDSKKPCPTREAIIYIAQHIADKTTKKRNGAEKKGREEKGQNCFLNAEK
jgi:hypothetical protein